MQYASVVIAIRGNASHKMQALHIKMVYVGCRMGKKGIVLTKTDKRDALRFLLFVFLLPYVCACLWGHAGIAGENFAAGAGAEGGYAAGMPGAGIGGSYAVGAAGAGAGGGYAAGAAGAGTGSGYVMGTAGQQAGHLVEAAMDWGIWDLPREEYLVYRLFLVMPPSFGYQEETLKAQAVLLRTQLAAEYETLGTSRIAVPGEGLARFYGEGFSDGGLSGESLLDGGLLDKDILDASLSEEWLAACRRAVAATAGEVLTYQGRPIKAPYFRVSNGSSRQAKLAGEEDSPYLAAVACGQDENAPDFRSAVEVPTDIYLQKLRGVLGEGYAEESLLTEGDFRFDGAGYMTSVSFPSADGARGKVDGETFRHLFGLASASFVKKDREGRIFFEVTGVGHGFGMSQYGADCRARAGENYRQILAAFFPGTELSGER